MKRRYWWILIIIVLVGSFLFATCKGTTGAFVTVVEVKENSIVVKNQDNELTTVRVPESTIQLIKIDTEYFVVYEWRFSKDKKYFSKLERIEPIE
ncbi:hypothetical protein [Chengkuizengella marina]|uniref:Uncharacterized protein n=1 Tax=Chengkuizengella marina TaxID=2507566 RepID=A0A6N9PXD0_9BACL|nr:hypothetical protein [Chengkuizengella marina]NBI28161.1 hypothetical protein [Chengkuizengella marina]